jgi:hypothetical protein
MIRKSVCIAGLFAIVMIATLLLFAASPGSSAKTPQPAIAEVKVDNFSFGPATSLRSQDHHSCKTRAACGVDPFPDCTIYCRRNVGFSGAANQAARLGRSRLLQLPGGGNFHRACSRYRHSRLAVRTRRAKTKRHPAPASSFRMRVNGNDLAGVVGAFPRPETASTFAELSLGNRISSFRDRRSHCALGRLPKRRQWSWLSVDQT